MKFTNTKAVGKAIGEDVVVLGKTSVKLIGDILRMPNAIVTDTEDYCAQLAERRKVAKEQAMKEACSEAK